MNPLGIHALVWTPGWSEPECRQALELTRETGFDLIEIPLLEPSSIDAAMTGRLLAEHGIRASCSLGLSFETDVSSEDERVSARGEELLTDAVQVTQELGASFLGGVVHSAMGKYQRPASDRGRRNCVAALRRVAELAAQGDITLGIEPVNRYESNLVNTAAQALELIDDIGAENVVVHLDSYHMNIEEEGFARPIELCGERLGYIHVGESHRGFLGTGTIAFDEFFRALTASGYDGPVTFESFSSAVISERFTSALAVWRDPWHNGRELAEHARRFLVAHLSRQSPGAGVDAPAENLL